MRRPSDQSSSNRNIPGFRLNAPTFSTSNKEARQIAQLRTARGRAASLQSAGHLQTAFHCARTVYHRRPRGKKTGAGESDRIAALVQSGAPKTFLDKVLGELRSGRDDFLDACAAAWTARRVFDGTAERLPSKVERDRRGLDMAMWL